MYASTFEDRMLQQAEVHGRAHLDGDGGDDGLCVDQRGVAQVVQATAAQDLGTGLPPHSLTELHQHHQSQLGPSEAHCPAGSYCPHSSNTKCSNLGKLHQTWGMSLPDILPCYAALAKSSCKKQNGTGDWEKRRETKDQLQCTFKHIGTDHRDGRKGAMTVSLAVQSRVA